MIKIIPPYDGPFRIFTGKFLDSGKDEFLHELFYEAAPEEPERGIHRKRAL
jgi:hypothetical protein